jgi:hypothetical protein
MIHVFSEAIANKGDLQLLPHSAHFSVVEDGQSWRSTPLSLFLKKVTQVPKLLPFLQATPSFSYLYRSFMGF